MEMAQRDRKESSEPKWVLIFATVKGRVVRPLAKASVYVTRCYGACGLAVSLTMDGNNELSVDSDNIHTNESLWNFQQHFLLSWLFSSYRP